MLCRDEYSKRKRGVAIAAGAVASLVMLGSVGTVKAVLITPGHTVSAGLLESLPSGTVAASESEPFTGTLGSDVITGTLFSEALNVGTMANPQYDFIYQVTNTGTTGDDEISRLSLASFAGFSTDVGYATASVPLQSSVGGSVAPSDATDPDPSGDVIAFDFNPTQIGLGQSTYSLIIATDANSFVQGDGSLTDDAIADADVEAPALEMGIQVPEPASGALLALIGGMLMSRRKRHA